MARPVLIDVEAVRGTVRNEVLHEHVGDTSGTAVRLDHHSLVATICVDVAESCMVSEGLGETGAQ